LPAADKGNELSAAPFVFRAPSCSNSIINAGETLGQVVERRGSGGAVGGVRVKYTHETNFRGKYTPVWPT